MESIFDAEGAHCVTIDQEPSLLVKGEDQLGKSGDQAEEISVNTNEVMDSQEDTSSVEIRHALKVTLSGGLTPEKPDSSSEPSSLWDKMYRELINLPTADDSQEVTIFRVPSSIRESNKKYMFEPSEVSIGPYYRNLPHLKAMENNKWLSLRAYLNYEAGQDLACAPLILQDFIRKIKGVEQRARCCYSEPFDMSSDDFVQMMILDACFILSYLKINFDTVANGWISSFITTDLILLENQIPFFIIETLWGAPIDDQWSMRFIAYQLTNGEIPIHALPEPQHEIHHLLHLCLCHAVPYVSMLDEVADSEPNHCPFRNWVRAVPVLKYLFCSKKEEELDEGKVWERPCATELEEAGVKFKTLEQSDYLNNITFQSGTLTIPQISITDGIKPLVINLVALEQCMIVHLQQQPHFSTYIKFMDELIDTAHDVKILQKNGILKNMPSGEQEVAIFFNQIGMNVHLFQDIYPDKLSERLNKFCKSRYNKNLARLYRDYFNSPWSIIGFIAATLLLFLTIIQSFMSVYAYISPPPSSPSS